MLKSREWGMGAGRKAPTVASKAFLPGGPAPWALSTTSTPHPPADPASPPCPALATAHPSSGSATTRSVRVRLPSRRLPESPSSSRRPHPSPRSPASPAASPETSMPPRASSRSSLSVSGVPSSNLRPTRRLRREVEERPSSSRALVARLNPCCWLSRRHGHPLCSARLTVSHTTHHQWRSARLSLMTGQSKSPSVPSRISLPRAREPLRDPRGHALISRRCGPPRPFLLFDRSSPTSSSKTFRT